GRPDCNHQAPAATASAARATAAPSATALETRRGPATGSAGRAAAPRLRSLLPRPMSAIDPRGFRPLNPISSRGFGCLLRTTPPGLREGADRTLASIIRRTPSPGGRPARGARHEDQQMPRCLLAHRRPGRLDLRLHGIEVEAGPLLHRRVLDRSHGQLFDFLLDEHEAPEFVLEPVEVLLGTGSGPALGPARALEGIEAKVGQERHVDVGLLAEPAVRLVDEAILEVADAHRAQRALAEVEDLLAIRGPLAGDHVHLVVAVEMHLVATIAHLLAALQLAPDVRVAGRRHERREPIEPGDDAVLDLARGHLARPADHRRRAEAAFHDRALGLGEWGLSAIRPGEDL